MAEVFFPLIRVESENFSPSKLLVKQDDIYLEDNKLRIKKDKEYNW